MKIEMLATDKAVGHLSVHAITTANGRIQKGDIITASQAEMLANSGKQHITCAIKDEGDMHEDEAANYLAHLISADHTRYRTARTGRINFTAASLGLLRYDAHLLKQINLVDEGITLALVQHNQLLAAGDMLATLKIIPFFIQKELVEAVAALLTDQPLIRFHPLKRKKTWLIQTKFDHQPDTMFDATASVTENRITSLNSQLIGQSVISHSPSALAHALKEALASNAELVLISGASAIAHRDDVIPSAITASGGRIDHFGLAVDPGNLLMIGHIDHIMIIGMPGCARSPKLNGFDWILQLYMAGIDIDDDELAELAAGGLLTEIASRPLPRALVARKSKMPHVAAILLAAGTSSRMGDINKLTMPVNGIPLVRRVANFIADSSIDSLTVIIGHQAEQVVSALDGIKARFLFNPEFGTGQASSVRCAVQNLPEDATDMMVFLGDMPFIDSDVINQLVQHHLALDDRWSRISLPSVAGQRGNPVIWGQSFFDEISELTGDTGARPLFNSYPSALNIIEFNNPNLLLDADTDEAFQHIKSLLF